MSRVYKIIPHVFEPCQGCNKIIRMKVSLTLACYCLFTILATESLIFGVEKRGQNPMLLCNPLDIQHNLLSLLAFTYTRALALLLSIDSRVAKEDNSEG